MVLGLEIAYRRIAIETPRSRSHRRHARTTDSGVHFGLSIARADRVVGRLGQLLLFQIRPRFRFSARAAQITRNAIEMTSGDGERHLPRPIRRRLIRTTLGAGPARPDADASDERIVELWLRDRPANTRVAYERDYGRFRAFIGPRSLRTVGLGDLSDFAATLTGSAATRRRTLSAIKALLTTGFKMGALRFNVGAALRLPKVVSRRAERRLEEIEVFRLLNARRPAPRSRHRRSALWHRRPRRRARAAAAPTTGPGPRGHGWLRHPLR